MHVSSVVYVLSACYLRGMTLNICFIKKKKSGKSLHQIHSCHLFFEKGEFIINFIVWLLWPPMLFGPKQRTINWFVATSIHFLDSSIQIIKRKSKSSGQITKEHAFKSQFCGSTNLFALNSCIIWLGHLMQILTNQILFTFKVANSVKLKKLARSP